MVYRKQIIMVRVTRRSNDLIFISMVHTVLRCTKKTWPC